MRKQHVGLFIPLIPTTAMAIHTSAFPAQRSHEGSFLKNLKGTVSVAKRSSQPEIKFADSKSRFIDTGYHGSEIN